MKRYYYELTQKDKFWFETLCEEAGIKLEIQDQPDGKTRYLFDEIFTEAVQRVLSTPEAKRPVPRKASLTDQIGGAQRPKIPDNAFTREEKKPSVREQLKQSADPSVPPTDIENRWAEQKLTEELKEIQAESEEADALLASAQEPAAETAGKKQRKKRKSKGRTNQIMTRLTDVELTRFQRRVKTSGLAQGEYLRSVALTGKVVIEERSMADVALLDELAMIRAELGRQGGLLKMIIKPNEGQRQITPSEWDELIQAVRDMEKMKQRLSDLEVKVTHGNSDPQNEQKRPVR